MIVEVLAVTLFSRHDKSHGSLYKNIIHKTECTRRIAMLPQKNKATACQYMQKKFGEVRFLRHASR